MPEAFRGTKTLLMGAPGSGKTWAISTLLAAGLEVGVIITDPGGEISLFQACDQMNLPREKLYTMYVSPSSQSWSGLIDTATKVNLMSYKDLSELKGGINKHEHKEFIKLLQALSNFKDDATGRELGPVDKWGPDRALVIDGLSGINLMCLSLHVGDKPAPHQGEWGVAMDMEEKIILKLTSDLQCFFVLICHVERTVNDVAGNVQLMAGALGNKLAPKLPRTFDDIVYCFREGKDFLWSTLSAGVDTKTRLLPLNAKMPADFKQVIASWKERQKYFLVGSTNPVKP